MDSEEDETKHQDGRDSIHDEDKRDAPGFVAAPPPPLALKEHSPRSARYERKEETPRATLNYQAQDLVFISIIIEGEVLEAPCYDSAQVVLDLNEGRYVASVCLAREKGSKRRSFNVNWGDIFVPARMFEEASALLSVLITDERRLKEHPRLPSSPGEGNSVAIPLFKFMKSYFEVSTHVHVPIVDEEGSRGAGRRSGEVVVTIHGHAHEAKEERTNRILRMNPKELVNVQFDPIPVDAELLSEGDGEYSDDLEDADEDVISSSGGTGKYRATHSKSAHSASQRELAKSLFPKASHNNLLALQN
jgi:hypothetical protein